MMKLNRIIAIASAFAMFSAVSCGGSSSDSIAESVAESSTESTLMETEQMAAVHKSGDSQFLTYQSNTVVATGNNGICKKVDNVTYRAYFPVEQAGELEYCFYFANVVDSTYNTGQPVYVGKETSDYTIVSAKIADGGTSTDDEITNYTTVTFDSSESREVKSGETFWSDPVTFDVPEGHYLVWEWTVSGDVIPATYMSDLTSATCMEDGDDEFVYCNTMPLPQLIGANRGAKLNVAAIGDSITQGCMTEYMAYEFWAAQISQKIGSDYAFWNCGLGWARASDAAYKNDWLERTKNYDLVIVAFGTNDITSGEYGGDGGNTAEEVNAYVTTIIEELTAADCSVIVFNAPPQDYDDEKEAVRTEYNELLKQTCADLGVYYFDFASYLSTEDDPSAAIYGGHPNGEAGGIVSDAFVEKFKTLLGN